MITNDSLGDSISIIQTTIDWIEQETNKLEKNFKKRGHLTQQEMLSRLYLLAKLNSEKNFVEKLIS
jgi:hypothetical protein